MAITTLVVYEKNKHLFGSSLNWISDSIKVDLLVTAHTPSQTHDYYDDVSANSATAAGIALATKTAAADAATGEGTLGAADTNITATSPWRYVVVYKDSGAPATSPLLYYGDAGSEQVAGNYVLNWASDILIRIV